jgi:hypothetical protein
VCRTAANVEYQRGDRSSIDDARLSKSIEFDSPHYIAAHMQIWPKIVKDAHRPTCTQPGIECTAYGNERTRDADVAFEGE